MMGLEQLLINFWGARRGLWASGVLGYRRCKVFVVFVAR